MEIDLRNSERKKKQKTRSLSVLQLSLFGAALIRRPYGTLALSSKTRSHDHIIKQGAQPETHKSTESNQERKHGLISMRFIMMMVACN